MVKRLFTPIGWVIVTIILISIASACLAGAYKWHYNRFYERVLIDVHKSIYDQPGKGGGYIICE